MGTSKNPIEMDTISVIIPFFNRARYLNEAVESVFKQNLGKIELILIDDGSSDASLENAIVHWENLCAQRSAKMEFPDRTLKYRKIPHSGMPGLARNRGVELATSALIAFLDSDDRWLPEKFEHQLPLHETFAITHTRELWLRSVPSASDPNPHFKTISQKGQISTGDVFSDALWKCVIGPSTVLMERALFLELGGFSEHLPVAEDYEFWLRLLARTNVGYVDRALVEKRAGMPSQDQLSEKFGYIEPFRVSALMGLLQQNTIFSPSQKALAEEILHKKLAIIQQGAEKRGCILHSFHDIIQYCEKLSNRNSISNSHGLFGRPEHSARSK